MRRDTKEKLILLASLLVIMTAESIATILSPVMESILNFICVDGIWLTTALIIYLAYKLMKIL